MTNQSKFWTAQSILEFLEEHRAILQALGVKKIGLFGSYSRDEQNQTSDIDLLVTIEPFDFAKYAQLWDFLEENLEHKVDLVPEPDLRLELRPYILTEVQYVTGL
jgi:hypothetical protein